MTTNDNTGNNTDLAEDIQSIRDMHCQSDRNFGTQAALMLDSGRFNLQANTDKIQHLL